MGRILFTLCLSFIFILSQNPTSSAWTIDKGPSEDVNGISFFHTSFEENKRTSGLKDAELMTFSHFLPDQKRLSKTIGLSRMLDQVLSSNTDGSNTEPGTSGNFKTSTSGRTSGFDNIPTLYMPMNNLNKMTVDDNSATLDTENILANYKPVGDMKPPVASEIFDFSAFNKDIGNIDKTAQINQNVEEPLETMNSVNYDFSQLGLAGTDSVVQSVDSVKDNNVFSNGLFSSENPSSGGNTITDLNNRANVNPFDIGSKSLISEQEEFDGTAVVNNAKPNPFGQLNNKPVTLSKNGPVFRAKTKFTDHSRKPMLFVKSAFIDTSGRQNPNMKAVSGFIDASTDKKVPHQKATTTTTARSITTTTTASRVATTRPPSTAVLISKGVNQPGVLASNNVVDLTADPNKNKQEADSNTNLNVDILYPPAPFPDKINPMKTQNTNIINQSGLDSLNRSPNKNAVGMNPENRVPEVSVDTGLVDYDMYAEVPNGAVNAVGDTNPGSLNSLDGNSFENSNANVPLKPVSNDNSDIFRTETNVQLINANTDSTDSDVNNVNKANQAATLGGLSNQITVNTGSTAGTRLSGQISTRNQNRNDQRAGNQATVLQTQSQNNVIQPGVGNMRNPGLGSVNSFQNQGNQMTNSGNVQNQNIPFGSRPTNIQNSNVQNNPNQAGNQMISVNNNILTRNGDSFAGSSQSNNFINQQQTKPSNSANQMVTNSSPGISPIVGATQGRTIPGTRQNLMQKQMPSLSNDLSSLGSNTITQNQWKGGQSSGQQFSNIPTGQFQSQGNGVNNQNTAALESNIMSASTNQDGRTEITNNVGLNNNGFNGQNMPTSQQGPSVLSNNNNNQLSSNNNNQMQSGTNNNNLTPSVNVNSATNFNQQTGRFGQNVMNTFGTVQNGGQNVQSNQNVLTQQNNRNSANVGNIVPNRQPGMAQTNNLLNNGGTSGSIRNVMSNGQNGVSQQNPQSRFGTNTVNSLNGRMTNLQQNAVSTNMIGNNGNTPRGFTNNNQQNGQQFGQFNNGQVQRQPGNLGNGMNTFRNGQNTNNIPMNSNQFSNAGLQAIRRNPPQMGINSGPTNPFSDPGVFNGPNIRPNFIPNNGLNIPRQNPFLSNVPALNVNQIRQNNFNGGQFMPFR